MKADAEYTIPNLFSPSRTGLSSPGIPGENCSGELTGSLFWDIFGKNFKLFEIPDIFYPCCT